MQTNYQYRCAMTSFQVTVNVNKPELRLAGAQLRSSRRRVSRNTRSPTGKRSETAPSRSAACTSEVRGRLETPSMFSTESESSSRLRLASARVDSGRGRVVARLQPLADVRQLPPERRQVRGRCAGVQHASHRKVTSTTIYICTD